MHYSQFIKLLCLLAVLGLGFLSVASQAQEATPNSQYSSYLEAIERSRQKAATTNSVEKPKAQVIVKDKTNKESVESICLAGEFCKKVDFSDKPDAQQLIKNCKQFVRHGSTENLSNEAHFCYSFFLGFGQALNMSSYLNQGISSEVNLFCVSGKTEDIPGMYLDFMNDSPDLAYKHFSYGVYRFFEKSFPCAKKE
jgi:hypothetical protein